MSTGTVETLSDKLAEVSRDLAAINEYANAATGTRERAWAPSVCVTVTRAQYDELPGVTKWRSDSCECKEPFPGISTYCYEAPFSWEPDHDLLAENNPGEGAVMEADDTVRFHDHLGTTRVLWESTIYVHATRA